MKYITWKQYFDFVKKTGRSHKYITGDKFIMLYKSDFPELLI